MQYFPYPEWSRSAELLARSPQSISPDIQASVATLLAHIKADGEAAVRAYSTRFDGLPAHEPLRVPIGQIQASGDELTPELRAAIEQAYANIRAFHAQQAHDEPAMDTMTGVTCWRKSVGIERVGLYIPGGTAPLFSTALMLGVPAQLGGCQQVVLCSPPQKDGSIHPAIRYAAHLCGITELYRLGGVQAIGAMAYGAAGVPRVYKIFGPGNPWVTLAKQQVLADGVAIDMPAGPSEVAIVADKGADPAFVAADLLSQAEHGSDSQVLLLTDHADLVPAVAAALEVQLARLPRRDFAEGALAASRAIVVRDLDEAMRWSNAYAPEHLILAVAEPERLAAKVTNAGSVFLGYWTPESAGDYASGTNHTLPTNGFARAYSGVSLDSFVRKITFQRITPEGLRHVGPVVEALAEAEGLRAHAEAVRVRYAAASAVAAAPVDPGAALVDRLLQPHLKGLKPYSSARDEAPQLATPDATHTWLDANENSLGDPLEAGYHRYPGAEVKQLRARLAAQKGVQTDQMFVGSGSDEAIDLLIRAFCVPGRDHVVLMPPTYGMYSVTARIAGVEIRTAALRHDFEPDRAALEAVVSPQSKLLFICSPNNPTGQCMPEGFVEAALKTFPGLVVVDEAYADFAAQASWTQRLAQYPNLVVLQTLSKAWGLAGLRIGVAMANVHIINVLQKIKYPYNLPTPSVNAALAALDRADTVLADVATLVRERERMSVALKRSPHVIKVYPSDANFILVQVTDAHKWYQTLAAAGIIVRNRDHELHCAGCLRITIGTPEENDQVLGCLGA
jgi:histidinol dehydrogenase